MWKNILFALASVLLSSASWAGAYDPIISMAWVGESIPGQATSTLQLNLTTLKPINLISVSSPVAESIEIHSLMASKGTMKMQVVNSLPISDHRTVLFGSGGLFLMMKGINQPLQIGDRVPLSVVFTFDDKQKRTVSAVAEVRKMELSYKHYGPKGVYDHR